MKSHRFAIHLFLQLTLVLGFLSLSFFVEQKNSRQSFESYIYLWEEELSRNWITQKNKNLIFKITHQVTELKPSFKESQFYSYGEPLQKHKAHERVLKANITQRGVPLGTVQVKENLIVLALEALLSPLFLGGLFMSLGVSFYYFNRHQQTLLFAKHQKDLSDLARQVAHDIRTPLSALTIISQKAKQINFEGADLLQKSADRIQQIANELLLRSKEKAKAVDSNNTANSNGRSTASTQELFNQILAEFVTANPNVRIIKNFKIHSDLCPLVVPSLELGRIITNLLNNAAEALSADLSDDSYISVEALERASELVISIQDNGKGIAPEILQALNQEGFSYNKPNGNGLGLAHAQKTLRGCGGEVQINSKQGVGSRVTLRVPKRLDYSSDSITKPNSSSRVLP